MRLEKSIGWQIAIVKKVNQFNVIIETENNTKGKIEYKDIFWTKKDFKDLLQKEMSYMLKNLMKTYLVFNSYLKLMVELSL